MTESLEKEATRGPARDSKRRRSSSNFSHSNAERTRSLLEENEAFPLEATARDLNWNLLRTFIVIAQEGSITRAANRLLLSQPSVSNSLRRLEEQLGMPLLKRGGSNFELTAAGLLVLEESLEVYGHISRLSANMADLNGAVEGTVRLALASAIPDDLLSEPLYKFNSAHPNVHLQTTVTSSVNAERSVLNKTSTLALVYVDQGHSELSYDQVHYATFGHFCGRRHNFFGCRDLTLDDLSGVDYVSMQTNFLAESKWPMELSHIRQLIQARIVAQSFNVDEVKRLVVSGVGVAMLPLHAVATEEADGRLWRLPPYSEMPKIPISLVINPRCTHTPAEKLFIDAMRQHTGAKSFHSIKS